MLIWVLGVLLVVFLCVAPIYLRSAKIRRTSKGTSSEKETDLAIEQFFKPTVSYISPSNIMPTVQRFCPDMPTCSLEPPVTPANANPLIELKAYLNKQNHLPVLKHFCGQPLSDAPSNLDDAIFVGLDMEWFERMPHPITEIGLTVMTGSALTLYSQNPEAQFRSLLQQISVFHCHIKETCHLVNQFLAPDASDNFQFGRSRYTTHKEAQEVLRFMLTSHTYADGTPRPVILLGHGLREDKVKLKKEMDIDVDALGNLVYILETRPLAVEANLIESSGGRLCDLVTGFGITPVHLHNAGNDIANATLLALLIGFKERLFSEPKWKSWAPAKPLLSLLTGLQDRFNPQGKAKRRFPANPTIDGLGTDDVMRLFQKLCQSKPAPLWGIPSFCHRCESTTHIRMKCTAVIEQPCSTCLSAQGPRNKMIRAKAKNHRIERCGWASYIKFEDPPDWVKTLSKAQRKEFQIAKSKEDYETLGKLVCAAYPRPMRDDSLEEEEKESLTMGGFEIPKEPVPLRDNNVEDDADAEENLKLGAFESPAESPGANPVDTNDVEDKERSLEMKDVRTHSVHDHERDVKMQDIQDQGQIAELHGVGEHYEGPEHTDVMQKRLALSDDLFTEEEYREALEHVPAGC